MADFYQIPTIPTSGVEDWKIRTLGALKQNVELLTGTRGEADNASRAVLKSVVTLTEVPEMNFTTATSIGCPGDGGYKLGYVVVSGIPISRQIAAADTNNLNLPSYLAGCAVRDDVVKLLVDLQNLRLAVENISAALRK